MIKTGIITPNSVTLGPGRICFAVGYRTDCYGDGEWLVRFTTMYENALAYVENEKAMHALRYHHNLSEEYKIWKCCLDDMKPIPAVKPPEEQTLDY